MGYGSIPYLRKILTVTIFRTLMEAHPSTAIYGKETILKNTPRAGLL
jgi:hypothetical protein